MLGVFLKDLEDFLPIGGCHVFGDDDLHFSEQIPGVSACGLDSLPFRPQFAAAGSSRGNGQRDRAVGRGDVDLGTLDGFGQRNRHADVESVALPTKMWVRGDIDLNQDIASRSPSGTRLPFAAKANFLPGGNPSRNLDPQRFGPPIFAVQGDFGLATQYRRGEGDRERVFDVAAARWAPPVCCAV